MSRQERELDAAEYVIGTLSGVERRAFEASIADDADTRRDVRFWERAFGALNASVAPAAAPKDMFTRIEAELFGSFDTASDTSAAGGATATSGVAAAASAASAQSDTQAFDRSPSEAPTDKVVQAAAANDNMLTSLQRSRGRWRFGAVAATIAALGLGSFLANERYGFVDIPGITGQGAERTVPVAGGGTEQPNLAQGLGDSQYVAVVNAAGDQPSLIVTVNPKTGDVSVRS
ncbi:MAG: hypothetical protein AAFS03_11910, partial [Pseudomonadota bacterium]